MIKQGDTELFGIDPKTGVIKTIRGLDYEKESQHILVVGTVENTSDLPGSTTRVVVNVQVLINHLKRTFNKLRFSLLCKYSNNIKAAYSFFFISIILSF